MTKTAFDRNLASPHLPAHVREEIEENPDGYRLIRSVAGSIRVFDVALDEPTWYYHGREIRVDASVPPGYWGHFAYGGIRSLYAGAKGEVTR